LFLCCFYFVVAAFICMVCIFMTYSTSYWFHYKLTDPWNVCVYVCVCMCVCVTEHHVMKAYCVSGGIAPHILDLGTRWR
jgi:hypothetical protein